VVRSGNSSRVAASGVAAIVALLAVALGGCASADSGIQAGERVDIYVSMPLHGPEAANGRDVVDGARLALTEADGKVGELAVRATYLDDTSGTGPNAAWSAAVAGANARRASQDSAAIAYIGDFDSGATRVSLPITNEAHVLQVSPAASAVDLVQPYLGAGDQVPEETQPTGLRTFGRVIPSDEAQAQAGAIWAKRLGLDRVEIVPGCGAFSDTMQAAFRQAAGPLTITRSADDLLYYAGTAQCEPASLFQTFPGPIMGSDALLSPQALRVQPQNMRYLTSAAEDPSQLARSGQRFVRDFRKRYHRDPGRYAAYGYEAMAVVLDSIRRAGDSGDDRDSVIGAFFDTTDRNSMLGTYSIDEVGNTTLDQLAGYRVVKGQPRFETALHAAP
jgi:branched-chain amino acid transport system substrate-binding protein